MLEPACCIATVLLYMNKFKQDWSGHEVTGCRGENASSCRRATAVASKFYIRINGYEINSTILFNGHLAQW